MRALECLQSILDFQHFMRFLSIQSPITRLTTEAIQSWKSIDPLKKSPSIVDETSATSSWHYAINRATTGQG